MVELGYDITGPADAPALVLLNSIGTTTAMWDAVIGSLETAVRVVRMDIRGHGRSAAAGTSEPCTMADLGRDVLETLDSAGLDRVDLAGMTFGGMTAIWLAGNHPERIDRLALIGTSAHPARPGPSLDRAAAVRANGMGSVADAVVARWVTAAHAASNPGLLERLHAMFVQNDAESYAQCCEVMATLDLRPELSRIGAPTLVIAGDQDPSFPADPHALALVAAIEQAELLELSTSAHNTALELPDVLASALLRHFAR